MFVGCTASPAIHSILQSLIFSMSFNCPFYRFRVPLKDFYTSPKVTTLFLKPVQQVIFGFRLRPMSVLWEASKRNRLRYLPRDCIYNQHRGEYEGVPGKGCHDCHDGAQNNQPRGIWDSYRGLGKIWWKRLGLRYSSELFADSLFPSASSLARAVHSSVLSKKTRPGLNLVATVPNERYGNGLLTPPGLSLLRSSSWRLTFVVFPSMWCSVHSSFLFSYAANTGSLPVRSSQMRWLFT